MCDGEEEEKREFRESGQREAQNRDVLRRAIIKVPS